MLPMPMAGPSTAAMSGLEKATRPWRNVNTGALAGSRGGLAAKSPRSLPAVKTPPAPSRTTTRTSVASSAAASACASDAYIAPVKAFFFSGRSMTMRRTPFASSTRI